MVRFADFSFDPTTGELSRSGQPIELQLQPARLLTVLLSRPGELVSRQDLRNQLWDDSTHVDYERCLNFYVRQLRRALGDDARSPCFVETLPRRGYRFVGAATIGARPDNATWRHRPRQALAAAMLAGLLVGGLLGHEATASPWHDRAVEWAHEALGVSPADCLWGSWPSG